MQGASIPYHSSCFSVSNHHHKPTDPTVKISEGLAAVDNPVLAPAGLTSCLHNFKRFFQDSKNSSTAPDNISSNLSHSLWYPILVWTHMDHSQAFCWLGQPRLWAAFTGKMRNYIVLLSGLYWKELWSRIEAVKSVSWDLEWVTLLHSLMLLIGVHTVFNDFYM